MSWTSLRSFCSSAWYPESARTVFKYVTSTKLKISAEMKPIHKMQNLANMPCRSSLAEATVRASSARVRSCWNPKKPTTLLSVFMELDFVKSCRVTHRTFFGSRENIRLNNPNPHAVPDTIRSSTGPSGAVSNGRAGVGSDIPIQRDKKLLLWIVKVFDEESKREFVVDMEKDGEDCATGEVWGTCDCIEIGEWFMASDTDGKPFGKTILKSLVHDQRLSKQNYLNQLCEFWVGANGL